MIPRLQPMRSLLVAAALTAAALVLVCMASNLIRTALSGSWSASRRAVRQTLQRAESPRS